MRGLIEVGRHTAVGKCEMDGKYSIEHHFGRKIPNLPTVTWES